MTAASALTGDRRSLRRPDGTVLSYRVVGDGPRDVLLAHGLTSTGALEWRYLLPLLAPTSRCLVPDLRGHGDSDHHDERHGWEVVADDLRALLAAERVARPHLVGFSFGSEAVLQMAVDDPGLPLSLTLLGSSTGRPARMPLRPDAPAELPPWPEALKQAHAAKHGPDHWSTLVRTMSARWASRAEVPDPVLAALPCPTLFVSGEHELPFKLAQVEHAARLVPGSRLVVVPGAGHEVHVQERELVGRLVVEHLDAAQARGAGGG